MVTQIADLHIQQGSHIQAIREELAAVPGHKRNALAVLWHIALQPHPAKFHKGVDNTVALAECIKTLEAVEGKFFRPGRHGQA